MEGFKKNNHFVPRMYLRQWSKDGVKVPVYRLLVSSECVPLWKQSYIKGIARHEHLYTRIVSGNQSDEFERWIDSEFENPAYQAIDAAAAGKKLSKDDWWNLVRFLAAQDVRTPARLLEGLKRWDETMPKLLEEVTQSSIRELQLNSGSPRKDHKPPPPYSELLPIRVTTQRNVDGDGGMLKVETDIGRGYWLFHIKHALSKIASVLHGHRWSFMVPPNNIEWITSDDPVLRLNFQSESQFNFGGGWASPGTEILMPISPKRLMYTKIGERVRPREIHLATEGALLINRMIARHAHRTIFASQPDPEIATVRPRVVSIAMVEEEKRQWAQWASNS